jgi:UDP-glucose 4-epimerase
MDNTKKHRILVTGGAGFIGSHLTDALLKSNYQVRVLDNLINGSLDNLSDASVYPEFEFIKGDILDEDACNNAMKDIDYVFHLACLGVRHSIHSPFENHRVNAEGTLNVLKAAREHGVKHFFYISTSEIYGRTTSFPISEEASTIPLTVYGASKLAGEHYTNAFNECYGLQTTVLRIFNNYGPRAHYEGDAGEIIPRSIVRILYDEQPMIFGDGSITRDFFFVKDTAQVLLQLLEISRSSDQKQLNRETFNIGTGIELTMRSLLERILELMGRMSLGIQYLDDRPADVPRLWVKANKFYTLTNFQSSYSFDEGLKQTILFYETKMKEKNLISDIKTNNWQ